MRDELDADVRAFTGRLFALARSGRTAELRTFVDAGLSPDLTDDEGDTLLILAASHDQPATVRMLLERGADTARGNDRGQTALGAAVARRSAGSVRALLAHGADPALGSPSALEVARILELADMLDLLGGSA